MGKKVIEWRKERVVWGHCRGRQVCRNGIVGSGCWDGDGE